MRGFQLFRYLPSLYFRWRSVAWHVICSACAARLTLPGHIPHVAANITSEILCSHSHTIICARALAFPMRRCYVNILAAIAHLTSMPMCVRTHAMYVNIQILYLYVSHVRAKYIDLPISIECANNPGTHKEMHARITQKLIGLCAL